MRARSLVHLSDGVLVSELKSLLGRERSATASVVAHMAEVDARKLYLPAGYPSMYAWCVGELGMSEDAAYKRIQAARAVRKGPAVLDALADGRLHLSGVKLLAPHLTRENADELMRAAPGRTRSGIEQFLAERFPRTESLPMVEAVSRPAEFQQQAPGPVQNETLDDAAASDPGTAAVIPSGFIRASSPTSGAPPAPAAPGNSRAFDSAQTAPGPAAARVASTRISPVAVERFTLRLTMSKATHEKLMHVQALLSHRIPAGDLAQVLDRVLDLAVEQLEKQKFAKSSKPRAPRGASSRNTRHIPAQVKRSVWERDGGCCTFVSDSGKRCGSRTRLEFDHVTPVAKGGTATVEGVRLRCRGHNHYDAERVFGSGFMHRRRARARRGIQDARTARGPR